MTSSKQSIDRRYVCLWMGLSYKIWLAMFVELWHVRALVSVDCMPFSMAAGCWSLENKQNGNVAFICTPSNWGFKVVPPRTSNQQALFPAGFSLLAFDSAAGQGLHTSLNPLLWASWERENVCEGDKKLLIEKHVSSFRDICVWKKICRKNKYK